MIREVLLDPHKLMERVGERAQVTTTETKARPIAHELKAIDDDGYRSISGRYQITVPLALENER